MQVNLDISTDSYSIHAYTRGEITIIHPRRAQVEGDFDRPDSTGVGNAPPQREIIHQSLIILPDMLIRDWPPQRFEDLSSTHFDELIGHGLELVLLGSGPILRWPQPHLLAPLIEHGVGVEVMDTGAACRTYNILMSDHRRFAAALLMG